MSERLYPQVLGADFARLPPLVRQAHEHATLMRGTVKVERGTGLPNHWLGLLARLPRACERGPCEVRFEPAGAGERWARDLNGCAFTSTLTPAPEPHCFDESFGHYGFRFRIHVSGAETRFVLMRHTVAGFPVPRFLWPRISTREFEQAGRYAFEVEARTPMNELLVRYCGELDPV